MHISGKEDNIKYYIKNNQVIMDNEKMSLDEFANWIALMVGVNEVIDCAERLGIDINRTDSWIKPLPLERYVREKGNHYYNQLRQINNNW